MKPKVVRMGDQNLKRTDDDSRARDYGIAQVIRHPDYKPSSKYNDIALLELDRDVPFSDYIKPACLWQTFDVNYSSGIATGWGLTRDRGNPSDELLKVQLNLITNDRCNEIYDRFQAIKDGIIDTQFCAGNEFEGKDTCNGDSGIKIYIHLTTSFAFLISRSINQTLCVICIKQAVHCKLQHQIQRALII